MSPAVPERRSKEKDRAQEAVGRSHRIDGPASPGPRSTVQRAGRADWTVGGHERRAPCRGPVSLGRSMSAMAGGISAVEGR